MGKVKYMETKTNRQERQSKEESTLTASCESPENESRVSTSSDQTYAIDAKELKSKVSFRKLLANDGAILGSLKPGVWRCNCPFCEDRYGKLYIWSSDAGAKCVECGWRGDIYDYIKKKYDVGFYDAVVTLNMQANNILRDEEGQDHDN